MPKCIRLSKVWSQLDRLYSQAVCGRQTIPLLRSIQRATGGTPPYARFAPWRLRLSENHAPDKAGSRHRYERDDIRRTAHRSISPTTCTTRANEQISHSWRWTVVHSPKNLRRLLSGHVKGAFTGADSAKKGCFMKRKVVHCFLTRWATLRWKPNRCCSAPYRKGVIVRSVTKQTGVSMSALSPPPMKIWK